MICALAEGRRVNACVAQHVSLSPRTHEAETQRNKVLDLVFSSWARRSQVGLPSEALNVDARVTTLMTLASLYLVRLWEYRETVVHALHT